MDENLLMHVEAIEGLEEEKKEIGELISERYSLAKGEGYDVKILRQVIRRRALEKAQLEEQDALLQTYEAALAS